MNKRHHRIVCLALIGMCLSFAQTAGAFEDPLRFTDGASASAKPFTSEEANAAREAYESALSQARDQLDRDYADTADAYRAVLEAAKSSAMQADNLPEAVKLNLAIEALEEGRREYHMAALQRRLENTTWTTQGGGRWNFFPEGRVEAGRKKKPRKSQSPWEVTDVNTIVAGTHPCLWIITVADDMRTMQVYGGCRDRGLHFEMRRAGGGSKARRGDDFKSIEVRRAHKTCDDTLAKVQDSYRKATSKARSAYRKALKSAKKSAMETEDLDEAIKLDKTIESFGKSTSGGDILTHAIVDTTWRPEDDSARRFDFRADGTYAYNQQGAHQWSAVEENTIIAGSDPYLWVITFDRDRKRARLRGTDGGPRLDLWIVRGDADDPPTTRPDDRGDDTDTGDDE